MLVLNCELLNDDYDLNLHALSITTKLNGNRGFERKKGKDRGQWIV